MPDPTTLVFLAFVIFESYIDDDVAENVRHSLSHPHKWWIWPPDAVFPREVQTFLRRLVSICFHMGHDLHLVSPVASDSGMILVWWEGFIQIQTGLWTSLVWRVYLIYSLHLEERPGMFWSILYDCVVKLHGITHMAMSREALDPHSTYFLWEQYMRSHWGCFLPYTMGVTWMDPHTVLRLRYEFMGSYTSKPSISEPLLITNMVQWLHNPVNVDWTTLGSGSLYLDHKLVSIKQGITSISASSEARESELHWCHVISGIFWFDNTHSVYRLISGLELWE